MTGRRLSKGAGSWAILGAQTAGEGKERSCQRMHTGDCTNVKNFTSAGDTTSHSTEGTGINKSSVVLYNCFYFLDIIMFDVFKKKKERKKKNLSGWGETR